MEEKKETVKKAVVDVHPEIMQNLFSYAEKLEGFSPRAIKFVAENMIINARRQDTRLLTHEIALQAINEAQQYVALEQEEYDNNSPLVAPISSH